MKNKTKKIVASVGGLAFLVGGFFAGRESKKIPETVVEIFRANNKAYLIRIYNQKEGWWNGVEIVEESEDSKYFSARNKEFLKRMDFQKRNPHIEIYIKDMDK